MKLVGSKSKLEVLQILKELESCKRIEFQLKGGKINGSHGSLVMLFFEVGLKKLIYQLLWIEKSYVPFIYLAPFGSSNEIFASDLDHSEVSNIVKNAINHDLEEYIQIKYREVNDCLEIKNTGYCEFCSPIIKNQEFFQEWINDIIEIYKNFP